MVFKLINLIFLTFKNKLLLSKNCLILVHFLYTSNSNSSCELAENFKLESSACRLNFKSSRLSKALGISLVAEEQNWPQDKIFGTTLNLTDYCDLIYVYS